MWVWLLVFIRYEGWSKSFEPGYICLHFGEKNVTRLSSRLLLVCLKNYKQTTSSACLLYRCNMLKIAGCTVWQILMEYAIVRWQSFWHWITFSCRRYTNEDFCIWWRCAIILHGGALGCWVSSRQKKPSSWAPGRPCYWKCCNAESLSQCAADIRRCGHKHWLSVGWVKILCEHKNADCKNLHNGSPSPKFVTRKWRLVDRKNQVKIWNSCNRTGICEAHSNNRWNLVKPLWPQD